MENLIPPEWPDSPHEIASGIFFTEHEVDAGLYDTTSLSAWLQDVANVEGFCIHRIDYILCTDAYLLSINQQYLDHDYYTDIITFPLQDNPIIAEIYISIDRVKENALVMGIAWENELHRVMVHGVLHLCGYNDHEEEVEKVMRSKEEEHLRRLKR